MSDHQPTTPAPAEPDNVLYQWTTVWHVVYLGGLAIVTAIVLWTTRGQWGATTVAMISIVAILMALYARVIMTADRWPLPLSRLLLYYVVVVALWLLLAWINPIFYYGMGMLIGQMFGVLPPVAAVPGVAVVLGLMFLSAAGWRVNLENIGLNELLAFGVPITFMFLLYGYIAMIIRNNEQNRDLVAQLQAANAELALAREQESELAALRERERVARDLHDGLGHSLVALSIQLEATQRLYDVDPVRASAQVDAMKQLTRDSMTQLRETLAGLRAPGLGERTLAQALADQSARLREAGLRITLEIDPAATSLRPAATEALWRVATEALANIERHAAATTVTVGLHSDPTATTLTITDDGVGLPPDAETRPGHFGLRGMRERVEGLGGSLTLDSGPAGTVVTATIPTISPSAP